MRPTSHAGLGGLHVPLNLPDLWQQDAVRFLKEGRDVVIDAPTGAGKTRVFELFIKTPEAQKLGQAVYTVPTRALANDKWREWKQLGWNVGIATGDVAQNLDAPVLVATLETQRERILTNHAPGFLILDEYQLIADSNRGLNYEMAMALPPVSTRLLLLSGSVKNAPDIVQWLQRLGRNVELVQIRERPVPLDDFHIENLPRVPDNIHGYWPRVAAGAMLAGLTPMLIFAPRRREAEKMANQIAAALPVEHPLPLKLEDQQTLGKDISRLLQRRVAYHHSGLPYTTRAKWIEPLGKSGDLQIIVATTGLAAGINFSVKTVLISSTTYGDGRFQRELRPDELLQMFGRAGRRGLDEHGYVLVAGNTPRLMDAAPRQLKRVNQVDWPTLLRLMEAHPTTPPLARAIEVCERLFSRQNISPGLVDSISSGEFSDRYGPTRAEYLGPDKKWHPSKNSNVEKRLLSECLAYYRESWIPALKCPSVLEHYPNGRPCRLGEGRNFSYGREIPFAKVSGDHWLPLPWVQKRLGLGKREVFDREALGRSVIPLLVGDWLPAEFHSLVRHGGVLMARLDIKNLPVSALVTPDGKGMLQAPTRRVSATNDENPFEDFNPPRGSAAYAWKKLGLVDKAGSPTARGRIFSRFQGGEGLVIAAALEDDHYPVDDIIKHLANIRGGPRFSDFSDGPSLRLAATSRDLYGHVDYEGYLTAGLCPGFGEGTWEALELFRSGGMRVLEKETDAIRRGDIERATLEWKSLLRHILHAADPGVPRWAQLQSAAAARLVED